MKGEGLVEGCDGVVEERCNKGVLGDALEGTGEMDRFIIVNKALHLKCFMQ